MNVSCTGSVSQGAYSSAVVSSTGLALGWIAAYGEYCPTPSDCPATAQLTVGWNSRSSRDAISN